VTPAHRTQRDASWSRAYGIFCYNCSKVLIFSIAMKGEKGVSFRTTYLPGERVGRNTSFGIDPGMGVPVAAYGDGEATDIDLKEALGGRLMRNSDHLIVAGVCPCGYELQLGEFADLGVPVTGESAGGVQSLPAARAQAQDDEGSICRARISRQRGRWPRAPTSWWLSPPLQTIAWRRCYILAAQARCRR
jgi:hypothetical protein